MAARAQLVRKLGAHGVNLAFDCVAGDGALGPAFGHHGTQGSNFGGGVPVGLFSPMRIRHRRCNLGGINEGEFAAVKRKVRGANPQWARQRGLKLGSGFEPLHVENGARPSQIRQPGACGPSHGAH